MTKILITGGAGFIGSHIIEYLLSTTDWQIVVFDKFTYAAKGLMRIKEIGAYDNQRVKIHVVDIAEPISPLLVAEVGPVDYILHMAAGTHVDNSIRAPRDFVKSNVLGTLEMLEYARQVSGLKNFLYFSTDEVFGPALDGYSFKEWDRYNSKNPYAATKAGGEELVLAYGNTYGLPVTITHTMNVIGERQHHEKFLPKIVRAAITGETIKVHTDPVSGKSGSRIYLHARDVAHALVAILALPATREKWNINGTEEISNADMIEKVSHLLGVHIPTVAVNPTDVRPGFDLRYDVDGSKLKNIGWHPPVNFSRRLAHAVWFSAQPENRHWLGL